MQNHNQTMKNYNESETGEVVEAVRCMDCEFWTGNSDVLFGGCRMWSQNIEHPEAMTKRDGFCYLGERKG